MTLGEMRVDIFMMLALLGEFKLQDGELVCLINSHHVPRTSRVSPNSILSLVLIVFLRVKFRDQLGLLIS
jgi:hypothetical protein